MKPIFLGVEDDLSESVASRLINDTFGPSAEITVLSGSGNGFGNLKKNLKKYCDLSQRNFVLVITDLDNKSCAPSLKTEWFSGELSLVPNKIIFRVAVREIEAWVMADREGFSAFLGIPINRLPSDTEVVSDPKEKLLQIARSARRNVRSEIIPKRNSGAKIGVGYNAVLSEFIRKNWDIDRAEQHNDSLKRARKALVSVVKSHS